MKISALLDDLVTTIIIIRKKIKLYQYKISKAIATLNIA